MAGRPWDASYLDGPAPWDIGHPQPAIARLAREGAFTGAVLDAGCGTGENALHIAGPGVRVLGVDVAEAALAMAREKAAERGIEAEFELADALRFDRLGRTFDTVLDCGLFHSFDGDDKRPAYVASLASVTRAGSIVHVLCFSDAEPVGPHPVSEPELRAPFDGDGRWSIASMAPASIETRFALAGRAGPGWRGSSGPSRRDLLRVGYAICRIMREHGRACEGSADRLAARRRSMPCRAGHGRGGAAADCYAPLDQPGPALTLSRAQYAEGVAVVRAVGQRGEGRAGAAESRHVHDPDRELRLELGAGAADARDPVLRVHRAWSRRSARSTSRASTSSTP